ncbi:MAG: hypothetical protein IJP04_03685 [Clostridia bacterium]|nr:hypothetical protein [Clostridiales bacterium]MBQ6803738.1 hypothetical protein [Clostridia bacterium]
MTENNQKKTFQYTYSAGDQEEIKKIRSKYLPKEENKMDQLRRLDEQVTQRATMYSLILGVLGTLILGAGMSLCLLKSGMAFALGILIGVIGMAVLGMAYPLYQRILKKEREKAAPEILRLTEELMK